jgi:1-acyl-sn-glycerol-3-phosphate acyltransferase
LVEVFMHTSLPTSIIRFKGSVLARLVLALFGWRVAFNGVPGNKGVIAVYPHTSNWDFPLGILAKWTAGIPIRFWGKDSLFKVPLFGRWMRWVGGVPVDRTAKSGLISSTVVQILATPDDGLFWLALAPEGTRKKIPGWRSGFYRVACEAGVPLCIAYFDYPQKIVGVDYFFMPTGDEAQDMARIAHALQGRIGCKPENMSPILLLDASVVRDESLIVS